MGLCPSKEWKSHQEYTCTQGQPREGTGHGSRHAAEPGVGWRGEASGGPALPAPWSRTSGLQDCEDEFLLLLCPVRGIAVRPCCLMHWDVPAGPRGSNREKADEAALPTASLL